MERLQSLAEAGIDFAFETILAARTFAQFIEGCKMRGYTIHLIYIWLSSSELAVERVARRVASGGHNTPKEIVRRRYDRGLKNLFELYLPTADNWLVFDNTGREFYLIAEGIRKNQPIIHEQRIWSQITG
jgi:predicted ABC-type ATPase